MNFNEIRDAVKAGHSAKYETEYDGQKFIRKFVPEDRLIILGAGHIARPLCEIASMLEYSVVVVDDRPDFANTVRFPKAAEVICDSFENALERIGIRDSDYVCVVTRGHRYDGACLRHILSGTMPFYLGMIGSRRRVIELMNLLEEEGFSRERLNQIHAPIGVPIGAVTVEEIAVSIIAQLIECRRSVPDADKEVILEQTNSDGELLDYLADNKDPKALLLVVRHTGSTPVKSGAVMAVDRIGRGFGTIGGGCSESAVMTKARQMIGTGGACIEEIDMSNDVAEEEGMVCGGHMYVLIKDLT